MAERRPVWRHLRVKAHQTKSIADALPWRIGPDDVWKDRIAKLARNLSRRNKARLARLIAELHQKAELSHAEQEFLLELGKAFRPYATSRRM